MGYLGLPARFARRLVEAGVTHPVELADWQPVDLRDVRFLGARGEREVTRALEQRLGMTCGPTWTPPPAVLRDPVQLDGAVAADGLEATAERLGVHSEAVTTWAALHAHVSEPDSPRERRPGGAGRAQAILDSGIPLTPDRQRLLILRAEHPDWTARELAQDLGWTRTKVERAWRRALREHPPEVVADYTLRRQA